MSLARRWHVVQTFSGAEWHVFTTLLKRGRRAFFPYTLGDRRQGKWTQGSIRPQFPSYLFAATDPGESVQAILTTFGVLDFLRAGVDVVVIPQAMVDKIKLQCRERLKESQPKRANSGAWQVGQIVAVPYGPLAGAPVEIRSVDRHGRIVAGIGALTVSFSVSGIDGAHWHSERSIPPLDRDPGHSVAARRQSFR